MKTKKISTITIIAIAVALNVSISNKKTDKASLLALANVEALASGEENTGNQCYRSYASGGVSFFRDCDTCSIMWFMAGGWNPGGSY